MKQKFRCFLFIAAIAVFAGFCSGCSADWKAKRVIQQAERSRSLVDFYELVSVLNEKKLSRSLRNSCSDLAIVIAKELVEIFWKEGNADGMAALYKKLSDEDTRRHINTDELRTLIRALQHKRLLELRKRLLLCDVRKKYEWQKSYFSLLEKAYRRSGNTELKKHIPVLIELGGILCGKAVQNTMLDVTDPCSRCRATGFEICYGCHGSGKCSLCKGSGTKISNSPPRKAGRTGCLGGGGIDVRMSCPPLCNVCGGSGYLTTPCKKCVGKTYLVNRGKIIRMYEDRYQSAMELLQVMLEENDSDSDTDVSDTENSDTDGKE